MSLLVRLPWPDPSLMPNRKNGKAWQSTTKVKNEQKLAAYLCTLAALELSGIKEWKGSIPLSLTYMPPDKRHRDLDNLLGGSKALVDGMALALGIDDSRFKPILVDSVYAGGEGAVIAAVGVSITSGVSL